MKIFKIIIPIILILILLISGCGGGDFSPTPPTPDTLEYSQWKARIQEEVGFFGFPKWWNSEMKNWKFGAYEEYSDLYLTAIILQWPDFPSPSEIYESKIYNCHRMTILLQDIFGGIYVRFDQRNGERIIGHAVLLSQWTVDGEIHVFCMSFGGICNIYDLGKINIRDKEEVQKALTPYFIIENLEIEPYK